MKTKIKAILLALALIVSSIPFSGITANAYIYETHPYLNPEIYDFISVDYYTKDIEWDLWERFLKYDLCITDYDSLTDEEKELCKFIFETERSASGTIVCERARFALSGDAELGDRLTAEQFNNSVIPYSGVLIFDRSTYVNSGNYAYCIPDIKHIDGTINFNEYWLNDEGTERILLFRSGLNNMSPKDFIYIKSGEEEKAWYDKHITEAPLSAETEYADDNIFYVIMPNETAWHGEYKDLSEIVTPNPQIKENGITYAIQSDGTAAIINASLYDENNEPIEETIIIPESIDGHTVTAIDNEAFEGTHITEVVLPDTITYIGKFAFAYCKYLESINFPTSLSHLGASAFDYCTNLKTVNINCPNLTLMFSSFLNTGIISADLTVRGIDDRVFEDCTSLETLTLNEGIESIDGEAFKGCSSLTSVKLPDTLKTIGQDAFADTSIDSLTIPSSTEVLGAFPLRYGIEVLSGLGNQPGNDPLTEEDALIVDSDCTINGYYNTEAHRYAVEWGLKFNPIDEDIAYGDLNLDGEISVADAVLLQSKLVGKDVIVGYEADLAKDGIIDVFDMIAMRSKLISQN